MSKFDNAYAESARLRAQNDTLTRQLELGAQMYALILQQDRERHLERTRNMRRYRVWCPDRGQTRDVAMVTTAYDEALAAEHWAERDDWNSAEYSIVGGRETPTVHVCEDKPGAPVKIYKVEGESVPSYTAREQKEKPCPKPGS
jgi:hypothetical protein